MRYFISGHRDLSYEDFKKYYVPKIQKILSSDECHCFIVGDCDGVDKFAMDYIYTKIKYGGYMGVLYVFHMFETPRNIPECYPKEVLNYTYSDPIEDFSAIFVGGFGSDEERDSAMTQASDFDIAFIKDDRWDSGTAQNIKRRHGLLYGI